MPNIGVLLGYLFGCPHWSVDSSTPSICQPGFESQARQQCFYQFVFELCRVEKDEINEKEAGIGPLIFLTSTYLER